MLYGKSLDYAYFVSLPHGGMGWPAVCDYAFLGHTLSFFETMYNKCRWQHYCFLNQKSSDNQRQKSLVFVGFIICYILVLESFIGMSYSVLY